MAEDDAPSAEQSFIRRRVGEVMILQGTFSGPGKHGDYLSTRLDRVYLTGDLPAELTPENYETEIFVRGTLQYYEPPADVPEDPTVAAPLPYFYIESPELVTGEVLGAVEVYRRGLDEGLSSLADDERLIYIISEFEIQVIREGWMHFFAHDDYFILYDELKEWLETIGDEDSLAALNAFEQHLEEHDVEFTPSAINEFWSNQDEEFNEVVSEWKTQYMRAGGAR